MPVPPLKFTLPYVVNTATDYSGKGFRITDSAGSVSISSISIVSDTVVEIVPARAIDEATAHVWYAPKTTFNGCGCLTDSDDALARENYTYAAGTGMYASADIPALVGKPYPLANWAVAFHLPVGYEE